MKAVKTTMSIVVTVLDDASIPALLDQMKDNIRGEFISGKLQATDGDTITWDVKKEQIEF